MVSFVHHVLYTWHWQINYMYKKILISGNTNSNKFSSGRSNRNPGSIPRSTNGYQGNRNRTNRPGGKKLSLYEKRDMRNGTISFNYLLTYFVMLLIS